MGDGDWGLGIGDWGLGIGDWAQSHNPNPQSPIPMTIISTSLTFCLSLIILMFVPKPLINPVCLLLINFFIIFSYGIVAHMEERMLSMHEARGVNTPLFQTFFNAIQH